MGQVFRVGGVLGSLRVVFLVLLAGLIVSWLPTIESKPQWSPKELAMLTDCTYDEQLLDLCQRCAKLTKSVEAYPSCCSEDISAREWCEEYVYFGTKERRYRRKCKVS